MKPRGLLPLGKLVFGLTLLVLLGLCSGCAVTSTPSSEPAANPLVPPTTLPAYSETFSSRALRNISEWQRTLTEQLPKP